MDLEGRGVEGRGEKGMGGEEKLEGVAGTKTIIRYFLKEKNQFSIKEKCNKILGDFSLS